MLLGILKFFIALFVIPYLQENVGLPVATQVMSNVKELPEKASKVLDKLEKGAMALITENTNYYYKVTYTGKNGEVKEEYVAKRNLKIIEEQEKIV